MLYQNRHCLAVCQTGYWLKSHSHQHYLRRRRLSLLAHLCWRCPHHCYLAQRFLILQ